MIYSKFNPKLTLLDKGYKATSFSSTYGAVPQRWLLVFSQQAYTREMATLQRTIEKEYDAIDLLRKYIRFLLVAKST